MEHEQYISQRCGRKRPFTVPDDYFNTLEQCLAARMDAPDVAPNTDAPVVPLNTDGAERTLAPAGHKAVTVGRRQWIGWAACLAGLAMVVAGIGWFALGDDDNARLAEGAQTAEQGPLTAAAAEVPAYSLEELTDYAMPGVDELIQYTLDANE